MPGNEPTMEFTKLKVPQFSAKDFRTYKDEVDIWTEVCNVPATKQGLLLWLELPRNDPSNIKELIMNKVGKENLKATNGVQKFMDAMTEAFGEAEEIRYFEIYKEFYKNMKRKPEEKITDFINRFDTAANSAAKHSMDLPTKVKGLKLLDDAGLSEQDTNLVLSEIDFSKTTEVYKQAKTGLVKYIRDENKSSGDEKDSAIKLDSVLTAQEEEVLLAKGWQKPNRFKNNGSKSNNNPQNTQKSKKHINPPGPDGKPLICPSCGSYRHLLNDCPDSYENQAKLKSQAFAAEAVENGDKDDESSILFTSDSKYFMKKFIQDGEAEDVILYTSNKEKIKNLNSESLGSILLDCGCTSNVMGLAWWESFQACLSQENKSKVKIEDPAGKKFRFGGGEVLPSLKLVTFPANLVGKKVFFRSHVVTSNIPLLWSRPSMAKAGTLLDLPNDRAQIYGIWTDLALTSVGHYALNIIPDEIEKSESCFFTLPIDKEEKKATLIKLHRQFGHPREEVMISLLKNAKCDSKEARAVIDDIYKRCTTCKKFSPTPPKPVVSLPVSSEFTEVLTMDLKEIKVHRYKYILHMIDGYSRFTVSVFIRDKRPETIVHNVMLHWVANYGRPGKIWTDVGGEFNNNTVRQMAEAIGCRVETGAGYAAWMNGLNERNHSVVDRCFAKIMNDYPRMDPVIALAWAVTAKNSFPMHGGFSSFQLVFGKNPKLPNIMTDRLPALEGITTSESVAAHINALYAGRRAFMEAQCDEKIRKALRHKVRAVEKHYISGEQVFYKRDGDKAAWRGPATVRKQRYNILSGPSRRYHPCIFMSFSVHR